MTGSEQPSWVRRAAAWLVAGHAAIAAGCLVAAPFGSRLAVAAVAAAAALWPARWLARRLVIARLPPLQIPPGRGRLAAIAAVVLAAASLVQTARLAAFSLDRDQRWGSTLLGRDSDHMCLAAYVRAAELSAAGEENLYERQLYDSGTEIDGLEPWLSDPYHYPPPFLLVGRAALAVAGDFGTIRAGWFALHAAALAALLIAVALALPARSRWRALALVPAVWIAAPTQINLQYGQVHMLVIAAALAAMVAFERGAHWRGGALLAAAIVAKISPAALVAVLLVQRRHLAVAATGVWIIAMAALAWLVLGDAPFTAFAGHQLPQLSSGEAFDPFFADVSAVIDNQSITGIGYKLSALGLDVDPLSLAAALEWLWLAVLVAVAWVVGRRGAGPAGPLALLVLASLMAPYLPGSYGLAAAVWLLALLVAAAGVSRAVAVAAAVVWVLVQIAAVIADLPGTWRWPSLAIAVSTIGQLATLALAGAAVYHHRSSRI